VKMINTVKTESTPATVGRNADDAQQKTRYAG